jgi:prolyl oligopeptidase
MKRSGARASSRLPFRVARISPAAAAALFILPTGAQSLKYPDTARVDVVDVYHGTEIADPYRWLEDDNSAATAAWVAAQNAVTMPYLERIPFRDRLRSRVLQLSDYERYSAPSQHGPWFFYSRNAGLENQSVLYRQRGLDGEPGVILDPNAWSDDGTVQLAAFEVSGDSRYAAYSISRSGSDWRELRVIDLDSGETLVDAIEWVKFSAAAWYGDGFFYSRYPQPAPGQEYSSVNENHQVHFHTVGTPQSEDRLVYEDRGNPQRFHVVETTEDERFAVLYISDRGTGLDGNAIAVRDLAAPDSHFVPLVTEITNDRFEVIDNAGDNLLVLTNHDAPNWRIVRIDPGDPSRSRWTEIVAERAEPIQSAHAAGGKLFVTYLEDVTTRAYVFDRDGRAENEVALPGPGSAGGFEGPAEANFVFYTFNSLSDPPAIYRYDIESRESSLFRAPEIPDFDASQFETRQVFYRSKDGTRIPMFLVHRRGLVTDGSNPTLLYGYGGFNIVVPPTFSAARIALLEQGFVYAIANIRGGGEYGEAWHRQGMKLAKQNVFDDFIAAAEWLIDAGYTTPARLAIQGGSNGGLLVGAAINQRPELFAAAVPQVGVMDMLRFQKFTIGWNWIADYGSSDDPAEFRALLAYSPLHNIHAGTRYPATLITTADHDDRVVPAHSFKYAAALQAAADPSNPVLIRIETKSGHGASNLTKQLESVADVYAFIMWNLGVEVR